MRRHGRHTALDSASLGPPRFGFRLPVYTRFGRLVNSGIQDWIPCASPASIHLGAWGGPVQDGIAGRVAAQTGGPILADEGGMP